MNKYEFGPTDWKPIDTAPKGEADNVIVGCDQATVWIVRMAFYRDGKDWDLMGFDSEEECRGWWAYENSVAQVKLVGLDEPTHWLGTVVAQTPQELRWTA